MLGHWQIKKKMPKRIAKLEMGEKKKTNTTNTTKANPLTLCTNSCQNVLNSVPPSSSVQIWL